MKQGYRRLSFPARRSARGSNSKRGQQSWARASGTCGGEAHLVVDDGHPAAQADLEQVALPAEVVPRQDRVVIAVNERICALGLGVGELVQQVLDARHPFGLQYEHLGSLGLSRGQGKGEEISALARRRRKASGDDAR